MTIDVWADSQSAALDLGESLKRRPVLLDAKIMMVDDEPLMTDLIHSYLEGEGYTNFLASNDPRDALGLLRTEQPAVLLLDLMMPQLCGFALLEAIRADRKLRYTPVIVLTASTAADSKLRTLRLGATDFLSKPVDASELVLRVRNTLAFRKYHEDLVNYDTVTRLPQADLFHRSLASLLEQRRLEGASVVLMSIHMPECRQVRESIDQVTADELAKVLSRRLSEFTTPSDLDAHPSTLPHNTPRVARVGADNFVLLLEGVTGADRIASAALRLTASLSAPISLGIHGFVTTPCIGIAVSPGDGDTAETLQRSADLAASQAIQTPHGTAGFRFASPEMNARAAERLELASQLRHALAGDQLRLHYQPKVEMNSGRVVGVEALVRWEHPHRGLLGPAGFIALAEELGLIRQIGGWVIERACQDTAAWAEAGLGSITVAVNVAQQQFLAGDLCQVLRRALVDSGMSPKQLIIELTESMLIDDVDAALAQMDELKRLGVTLSIDDFGTGFSSLNYLKRFPLDELKIDRSFVRDLPGQRTDIAIVRTVIELGHNLDMSVNAEGVETEAQRLCLAALGCDTFQGFLVSQPLRSEGMAALLAIAHRDRTGAP